MEMVKPGVESIHLIFSDGELTGDVTAYRFPFYEYSPPPPWPPRGANAARPALLLESLTVSLCSARRRYAEHLDRILDSVLGADKGNVIRLQLARMKPGTVINHHQVRRAACPLARLFSTPSDRVHLPAGLLAVPCHVIMRYVHLYMHIQ